MKTGKFNPFACIAGVIALFLLQGCDKEIGLLLGSAGSTVKQIDMTVLVPIHPSSLEYFDYCISYSDNTGEEYRDTVRNALPDNDIFYWMETFAYKSNSVVCRCEVELVPKVSRDSVVSFSYTVPKPCIFSRVIYGSHSTYDPIIRPGTEGLEVLDIEDMRIGTFMSAYGSYFVSTCRVKEEYGSISCQST
ncbi:MAG: hypothetical protein MJY43_03915 [Bacteroidales bacterium]|nr:hypothetical protein [Bacteroidales bacterium]